MRMVRGTACLMAGKAVFLVCGYTVHLVLSRYLGPQYYGMYGVIMSLLIWVELTVITGIPTAVKKYVAETSHLTTAIKKKATRMQIVHSGAVLLLLLAMAPMIAGLLGDKRLTTYLWIAGFDIPVYALFHLYAGVMNGRRDFGRQTISLVVYSLSKVTAISLLVFLGYSLTGALVGNILASLVGLAAAFLFCRSYDITQAHGTAQSNDAAQPYNTSLSAGEQADCDGSAMVRFAIPIILLALTHQLLLSLGLFCVKALTEDAAQTGYYTLAGMLAKAPYFIFLGLSATLFPTLVHSLSEGRPEQARSHIKQALLMLSILAIPLAIVGSTASGTIISVCFSDTYLPAAHILSVLIIGSTFFTYLITLSAIMVADNKPYLMLGIVVPLIALNFVLNLKLIPAYGPVGAAWGTTITTMIGLVAAAAFVYRRFFGRGDKGVQRTGLQITEAQSPGAQSMGAHNADEKETEGRNSTTEDFRVDFIGIGASKSGTTWLTDCLFEHPEVSFSEPKEVRYFNETVSFARKYVNKDHNKPFSWYKKHFLHCKKDNLIGEFSPHYLYDEKAPALIKQHFPDVKLIVCLRNPMDRAYSEYGMHRYYTLAEKRSFEDALEEEAEYIGKGLYFEQLQRVLQYFPKDRMHVILFDDIVADPESVLKKLLYFLGVDSSLAPELIQQKSNILKRVRFRCVLDIMAAVTRSLIYLRLSFLVRFMKQMGVKRTIITLNSSPFKQPAMNPATRDHLRNVFKDDISKLEALLQLDLSHWK